MTPEEILDALARVAARRVKADEEAKAAEAEERPLIAEAWRAGIGPKQIAETAHRSEAHARKLRPDDVPPLRTGGGYAAKNARRRRPVKGRK